MPDLGVNGWRPEGRVCGAERSRKDISEGLLVERERERDQRWPGLGG